MKRKTIFFKPKSRRLAKVISIKSPSNFKKSIAKLKRNKLTLKERKALILARTRVTVQLKRKNLSLKERKQFKKIANIKI